MWRYQPILDYAVHLSIPNRFAKSIRLHAEIEVTAIIEEKNSAAKSSDFQKHAPFGRVFLEGQPWAKSDSFIRAPG
jgi:hypothetical protein